MKTNLQAEHHLLTVRSLAVYEGVLTWKARRLDQNPQQSELLGAKRASQLQTVIRESSNDSVASSCCAFWTPVGPAQAKRKLSRTQKGVLMWGQQRRTNPVLHYSVLNVQHLCGCASAMSGNLTLPQLTA